MTAASYTNQEMSMTATSAPAAPKKPAEPKPGPAAAPQASERKRVRLTEPKLKAVKARLDTVDGAIEKVASDVDDLMFGRRERSGAKVDALRAIESRIAQLATPIVELRTQLDDLIELVLDDD